MRSKPELEAVRDELERRLSTIARSLAAWHRDAAAWWAAVDPGKTADEVRADIEAMETAVLTRREAQYRPWFRACEAGRGRASDTVIRRIAGGQNPGRKSAN